jgi:outer membrane protein TolC
VSTYALRGEVDEAFFTAALMQARSGELGAVIADLEAQLRVAQSRVREGSALPSEAALLEAELLRRRQDQQELAVQRGAALAVLSTLSGRSIRLADTLALPDLAPVVAGARGGDERARPEYEQFARMRERLAAQSMVLNAQTKPRVVAYGRSGYGKPGLNFLNTGFQGYWLAGVQVQWAPWTWGVTDRDREALAIQQEIVAADEAAFAAANRRVVERQLADVARLEAALRTDADIISLRERIERETRRRFEEAVVTAAEYVDRRNDVLAARMARATHEVELSQARARYLTTIGVGLR